MAAAVPPTEEVARSVSVEKSMETPKPNPNLDLVPNTDLNPNPDPGPVPSDGASVAAAVPPSPEDALDVVEKEKEREAVPPSVVNGTEIPDAAAALPAPPQTEVKTDGPGNDSNGNAADTVNPAVLEVVKPPAQANKNASEVMSEVDSMHVPENWLVKPSLHVSSIGGKITEEELTSLFRPFGKISSITFENERQDGAIVRYERIPGDSEDLALKVRGALNSMKLGERTLIVENIRPDSLLFVGNLTPDVDDAALVKMFEPHGRIERAFVLKNGEGRSKCYGFVEYSLKSEAAAAKAAMENMNMDGRVLRVEWSDCRKIADMFSTVLFVDRIAKDRPHIEQSLRNLFSQFGEIRDCHLAIGLNQQLRGFGFIDFYHSAAADKVHKALDGYKLEGSEIRVSFANPSKSAQSYKVRYGAEAAQTALGLIGRGTLGDRSMRPSVSGMLRNASLRGPLAVPILASRLMGSARPRMLGMGIGMQQFTRGAPGSGAGMPRPNSMASGIIMGRGHMAMAGNMAPRAGSTFAGSLSQMGGAPRLPMAQGSMAITSAVIAQVATAQAKAREEEAKARAEARRQSFAKAVTDNHSSEQYQKYQANNQQFHSQQAAAMAGQYAAWNQQAAPQVQQAYAPQLYDQSTQPPVQQQQMAQSQNTGYYQQQPHHVQSNTAQQQYAQQQQQAVQNYAQTYGQAGHMNNAQQQYAQQAVQNYAQGFNQPQPAPSSGQEYVQQQYTQQAPQNYGQMQQQYAQQTAEQQYQQQSFNEQQVAQTEASAASDPSQQQAYAAYYQQQAQNGTAQSGTTAPAISPATQQSYEAQWAAYYASQAAYQQQQASQGQQQAYVVQPEGQQQYYEQQASTADAGSKRTAEQMESGGSHAQMGTGYSQQGVAYTAQSGSTQQEYQQGYEQPDGYQQQYQAAPAQGQAASYDYSKRARY